MHKIQDGKYLVEVPEDCGRIELFNLWGTLYITDKSGDVDYAEPLPHPNMTLGKVVDMSEDEAKEWVEPDEDFPEDGYKDYEEDGCYYGYAFNSLLSLCRSLGMNENRTYTLTVNK